MNINPMNITHRTPIARRAALLWCTALLALPFCPPLRAQEAQEAQTTHETHESQATHEAPAAQTSPVAQAPAASSRPPRLALTANLLSWATLAPNLGAELYLAPRWSLAADASFGLWTSSHRTHAFRSWSAGGELRYWLHSPRGTFRRTHIGLSVRGGEYDDTFFGPGTRGEALMAGITLGYRFHLPRRWQVDAGIGAGFIHTRYDRYRWNSRFHRYEHTGSRTRNLPGITDLHVSLVRLF